MGKATGTNSSKWLLGPLWCVVARSKSFTGGEGRSISEWGDRQVGIAKQNAERETERRGGWVLVRSLFLRWVGGHFLHTPASTGQFMARLALMTDLTQFSNVLESLNPCPTDKSADHLLRHHQQTARRPSSQAVPSCRQPLWQGP